MHFSFVIFFRYQSWNLYFVFLITSDNIFVSVMESLQIPISKMKWALITLYRCFQFLGKAVAEVSDFTVETEFKAIQNILWKCDLVFFDFIFGQSAIWKWFYDVYIIASFRSKINYNVPALEMLLILYF